MNFIEKLDSIIDENNSLLCVGLDIDKDKIPMFLLNDSKNPYFDFNKSIVDETKDIVCAYKLNMAFYESLGFEGFQILKKTVDYIPKNIITILDGKRNDIGNTARMYAKSIYGNFKVDSTTLNAYLGIDSIKPFLEYKNKCNFVLCRTSNQSAKDFQDLIISNSPLYQIVATKIKQWNQNQDLGAVVGATYPDELKVVRKILGDNIPILIPGVGSQGGDVEKTIKNGTNYEGKMALINSSRGIIYAGKNEDFSVKSKEAAIKTRDLINKYR